MILGAMPISYYPNNRRYSTPRAWRPGEAHPNTMKSINFREALSKDWCAVTNNSQEVWLYPLAAQGGGVLRPSKQGSPDIIKRELNIDLFVSGLFIDLDDVPAHAADQARSGAEFFDLIEYVLTPLMNLPGSFYYRTLRGARVGLVFEQPVELALGERARRGFFAQVESMFEAHESVEVDRASIEVTRGFAAPMIYKRGERITDTQAQLKVHERDTPIEYVSKLADYWTEQLKQVSRGAADSERRPQATQSAAAREGAGGQDTRAPKSDKKPPVVIPHDLQTRAFDRTQLHNLFRGSVFKLSHWVQDEALLRDLSTVLDRHLCAGRRAEGGELTRYIEQALEFATIHEDVEIGEGVAPPAPVDLLDFPELQPLRRTFVAPLDDLKVAQAVLDAMGAEPAPLWHGEGLRRYSPQSGVWELYRPSQLERILLKLEGAQHENDKGEWRIIPMNNKLITGGVKMLASVTGAGEIETPFDTAPMGVVLGKHFISASLTGLTVQPRGPEFYAIHALDYDLSPNLIQYWDDEDTGAEPREPTTFTRSFLARSLRRAPEDDETPETIAQEVHAKITTIGEWLGLAMLGLCTREATALVAHGPGSNGKSVLASLITDLFGAERTAHLAPQAMKERFSRAQLFGAAVNVVSEMPESDLLESDTIKAMISGDAITVENKGEKPFRMIPRAAHFFAANTLPASRDRSHGLWRRLIPVEFHHIFTRADRDPDLLDKLRAEYDLLVPWALDLARQYIERGGYRHQDYIDQWRGKWRIETDAVSAFIATQCDLLTSPQDEGALDSEALWQRFRTYAEDVGQTGAARMSLTAFGRSLRSQPGLIKARKRKSGKQQTFYNLKIKDTARVSAPTWSNE